MSGSRVAGILAGAFAVAVFASMSLVAALFSGAGGSSAFGAAQPFNGDLTALGARLGVSVKALQGLVVTDRASLARTGCHAPWWLLGGVGVTESGLGTSGGASIGADWQVRPPIGGPPLDGNGFALVLDGLGGVDRARGPFQFIGSSWLAMGVDATGDGVADPDNFLDAAMSAANHLCLSAGGRGADLTDETTARRALHGYNPSDAYVAAVWARAVDFRVAGGDNPGDTNPASAPPTGAPVGRLVDIPSDLCARAAGCQLDASWAPNLVAALRDAAADGYSTVVISAYRSFAEQSVLYARNCPTPDCPGGLTARPGTSNHEGGQAADLERAGGPALGGPGDPWWEEMKRVGLKWGVIQSPAIQGRDPVHFSATGN